MIKEKIAHNIHGRSSNHKNFVSLSLSLSNRIIIPTIIASTLGFVLADSTYADTSYSITYSSGVVSNMPVDTNNKTLSENVILPSSKPTRSGYSFLGWCNVVPTTTDGTDSCTGGTSFQPSGSLTVNQTSTNNNFNLYAMWEVQPTLYDNIATLSKGKNIAANNFSWTSITQPTSTDPSTDTSTSGVYEWGGKDGTGTGTDSNGGTRPIYFYRGILDTTLTSHGSDGLADAYPNYVVLSSASGKDSLATTDTCWRIVRTTSTGGVKMIYNGTWTGSTCANVTDNAQTKYNGPSLTVPFNTTSSTKAGKTYTGLQYQNIHAVGYTYSNVAAGTTDTKTPAELFGASGNDTTTNTNSSIMKKYIEDWYSSTLSSYTSKLEGDAGYCQDRRLNTDTTWTTPLAEDSNTIVPYGTTGLTQYYFGASPRNIQSSTFDPLLTCPRGKVDLYSYSGDTGNGNGQLTYPVALLTADEVTLAGSGYSSSTGAYNANSFLRSGSVFWLLSPCNRASNGNANEFRLGSVGGLSGYNVDSARGVRPVISLQPGTTSTSGTGIATDPWIINPTN